MARAVDVSKLARDLLAKNRKDAIAIVQFKGERDTHALLEKVAADLESRIERIKGDRGKLTFTRSQLEATLAQVRVSLSHFTVDLKSLLVNNSSVAAEHAAAHAINYLKKMNRAFTGSMQPLALREASMMDAAKLGAKSSLLRRIASSGTKLGVDKKKHRGKLGVLQRYGVETVGVFERTMQKGIIAKKSWQEMADDLKKHSPFLKGAPNHWARRIVRTEVHGAYSRASLESIKTANDDLGDMCKILSATFDEVTGADSYAVHGQIRLPDEPFETWFGEMDCPPNRPNDREIVVPHRIKWKIPPSLEWRTDEDIADAWMREGRKGEPPERPLMTTIDLDEFGSSR